MRASISTRSDPRYRGKEENAAVRFLPGGVFSLWVAGGRRQIDRERASIAFIHRRPA
jgi:hypothetical protein